MALRRRLHALGYPTADVFDPNGVEAVRNLIVWLEDTKICYYPVENRELLRQINRADWNQTFTKYAVDLGCPYRVDGSSEEQLMVLDFIVGQAVLLQYSDNVDVYSSVSSEEIGADPAVDLPDSSIRELAALLKLPSDGDPIKLLEAIATVLKSKFNPLAVSAAIASKDEEKKELSLKEMPLGFSTGDHVTDKACKVLRLLHIADLRDLQTRINELIVKVQSLTADPKTNIKLGRVGK